MLNSVVDRIQSSIVALSHGKVLTRSELALRMCSRTARTMALGFDEEASNLSSAKLDLAYDMHAFMPITSLCSKPAHALSRTNGSFQAVDMHVSYQSLFSRFDQ